ncbi:MAG: LPS assembly lipoprotein LptE [Opitutaceae bacterium]|jgi:hypothetical protein|nr:LPS assembly lipoprotein LptE [Opitutaceae bacterium]
MLRLVPRLALALPLLALAACAYRLGTGATPDFKTLYVAPVVVEAVNLPQASALLTTQIRETLARDGRVVVVNTSAGADATLAVRVSNYSRDRLMSQRGDTGLARKFALNLDTRATLTNNRDARDYFKDRPIRATGDILLDNPDGTGAYDTQLQSEYQALPKLAETLAATLKHTLLDTW